MNRDIVELTMLSIAANLYEFEGTTSRKALFKQSTGQQSRGIFVSDTLAVTPAMDAIVQTDVCMSGVVTSRMHFTL